MKTCPLLDLCSLKQADRSGFTLVELLVVVFILSTLALTGLALTETADSQLRFEDTQARLRALKRAVVGDTEPVFDGRRLLSGFVVDNGLLPPFLQTLKTGTVGNEEISFVNFGSTSPVFDPKPDANGLNDGNVSGPPGEDEVVLDNPGEILFKGFRGPYINIRAGTDLYRDGWGNVHAADAVDDSQNYGWRLESVTVPLLGDGLRITSFGSDGLDDALVAPIDEVYGHDLEIQIAPQDWQVDLGTLTATVLNETGQDVPSPGDGDLLICVLVYLGGAPGVRWKRINGTPSSTPIPSGGEATFTFPAESFVPIGRHLALLISDPDGVENSGDEEPFESPGSEERVSAQASFYPRTYPQNLTLSIR